MGKILSIVIIKFIIDLKLLHQETEEKKKSMQTVSCYWCSQKCLLLEVDTSMHPNWEIQLSVKLDDQPPSSCNGEGLEMNMHNHIKI